MFLFRAGRVYFIHKYDFTRREERLTLYCVKNVKEDLIWVGGSDRRLALFENVFPIPRGVSYNAYLVQDEQTVLMDTVDSSIGSLFFENLEHALNGKMLNYVVVNHMEPDHAATLSELVLRHPEVTVVCNAKTIVMIRQFFNFEIDSRALIVKEGDTLCTGRHTFTFVMAPMVHWPEAMVTYDVTDKVLCEVFGYSWADQVEFSMLSREKFTSRAIKDTVARNGRDPLRKLASGERIMGPMRLIYSCGKNPDVLIKTAACALLYKGEGEDKWEEAKKKLGIPGIMSSVMGLSPDEDLYKRILAEYERIKKYGL